MYWYDMNEGKNVVMSGTMDKTKKREIVWHFAENEEGKWRATKG